MAQNRSLATRNDRRRLTRQWRRDWTYEVHATEVGPETTGLHPAVNRGASEAQADELVAASDPVLTSCEQGDRALPLTQDANPARTGFPNALAGLMVHRTVNPARATDAPGPCGVSGPPVGSADQAVSGGPSPSCRTRVGVVMRPGPQKKGTVQW